MWRLRVHLCGQLHSICSDMLTEIQEPALESVLNPLILRGSGFLKTIERHLN